MFKRIGVLLVIFLMAFSQVAFASGNLAPKRFTAGESEG